MPYIEEEFREKAEYMPKTSGELNFAITKLILNYVGDGKESYTRYNDCLGALEGAKLELYRRRVAPYEDIKIGLNGDVYD